PSPPPRHPPSLLPLSYHHTPTPPTSTLSLHDALPISPICNGPDTEPPWLTRVSGKESFGRAGSCLAIMAFSASLGGRRPNQTVRDRKSTRLNSSHVAISYAVLCLKKIRNEGDGWGWCW